MRVGWGWGDQGLMAESLYCVVSGLSKSAYILEPHWVFSLNWFQWVLLSV